MLVGKIVSSLRSSESRYLHGLSPCEDMNKPEAPTDDECATEQRFDLFRRGIRRDVEVFRDNAEKKVPHGTANDESLEARIVQLTRHLQRSTRQRRASDRM